MTLRHLAVAVLLLALGACSSTPPPATAPAEAPRIAGTATVAPGTDTAAAVDPAADSGTTATPIDAGPTDPAAPAADAVPTAAEDDYAALYGEDPASPAPAGPGDAPATATAPAAYDPWEPMNRRIHAFNLVIDDAIAQPLAKAYVAVVPQPMRLGVANFFDNLGSPVTFVNQLLQGRPRDAVQTLGRFVVNSTLGIGGIFDPASDLKMKRRSEDFGQTLGIWGWRSSRYVELPFFGPRTVRDVFGLVGDMPLSVSRQVEEDRIRIFLQGMQLVDRRSALLSLDEMRRNAPDEYAMIRNAWLARRAFLIEGDRRNRQPQESDLPDYLRDEERDPTVPADAMPMPTLPGG